MKPIINDIRDLATDRIFKLFWSSFRSFCYWTTGLFVLGLTSFSFQSFGAMVLTHVVFFGVILGLHGWTYYCRKTAIENFVNEIDASMLKPFEEHGDVIVLTPAQFSRKFARERESGVRS